MTATVPSTTASRHHGASDRPPFFVMALSLIWRRHWLILGTIVTAILFSIIVTMLMRPQYTASTAIEIQRESRNFTMVQGAESDTSSSIDQEFYQTQYGLLQARSLSDRVATNLKLYDSAAFFEMFSGTTARRWFEDGRLRSTAPSRAERTRAAGQILLNQLEVDPQRLSRLVFVRFTSPDAAFSKKVIDAWSANFIDMTMERRVDATSYARRFLEGRLNQLRTRIDEGERQLVTYAGREGIINLPNAGGSASGEGGAGERSIIIDDLTMLNRELDQATADRIRAESRLRSGGDTVTEALDNPAISGLRQRRAEIAADYAKMMAQFEADYPPAVALQRQLQQLDRSITREESRVQSTISETHQAAQKREASLKDQVAKLKIGVLDLRRRSIQYNVIKRDVDTNQQLYDALLQRFKEIGVAGNVGVSNISIIDNAELPEKPSSPKLLLNLLAATLLGGIFGIGIAIALEQIDQSLSNPDEIEREVGIPLIGTIPVVEGGDATASIDDRKSFLSEAYTSLRTNLAFSTSHGLPRSIGVTSTQPAEGKTTTSLALAVSIARLNKRVILVDGDMRSPSIHVVAGIDNKTGLSTCLSGNSVIDEAIFPTRFKNLSAMAAGPHPPSAPELLSSDQFGLLLADLLGTFDHVVIDMPPVMGIADAPLIASRVEGIVYVVEANRTSRNMARVATERLRAANAAIIGAVMTKFNAKRSRSTYGYGYGYGYGDGSSSES